MSPRRPELSAALSVMLDRIDSALRTGGHAGEPVRMYLAGGMALHYHLGSRYTEDVDASFSARVLMPTRDLTVDYRRADGKPATLYFDSNYNDSFALMHPDYRKRSLPWEGIGNERRLVELRVLTPLDLAVSKLSRFSEQDREDIALLANAGYFTEEELRCLRGMVVPRPVLAMSRTAHFRPSSFALAPAPHRRGQPVEHAHRGFPIDAGIRDALAIARGGPVDDRLISLNQVTLEHHPGDGV